MAEKKGGFSGAMSELSKGLAVADATRAPGKPLYARPEARPTAPKISVNAATIEEELIELDPKLIEPWEFSNRPDSEFGDMDELAASIKNDGQQNPIRVRPAAGKPGRFEVIYGRRRWKACMELAIPVKCVCKPLTDAEAFVAQAVENEQRKDLSAWARALDYQRALDSNLFPSVQALATKLRLDRTTVSNILTFTRIPKHVADAIGDMSRVGIQMAKTILALSEKHADVIIANAEGIREGRIGSAKLEKLCSGAAEKSARVIKGKGGDLFSVAKSARGTLTLTILKNGKELMSEEELIEKLKAVFEAKAETV